MRVIHFHNGKGGGVFSVIRNLLQYSQNSGIENEVVYVINREENAAYQPPVLAGAVRTHVFYYSANWNFYYTCKQLAAFIHNDTDVLIAHDWLELGMVTQLGLANPVIQFIHGDYEYYYQLAAKHAASVNGFICVSASICYKLQQQLAERANEIEYLALPVPDAAPAENQKPGNRIVFIGRCEEGKGYHLLPQIDELLQQHGCGFEWHVYGEGSLNAEKQSLWSAHSKVLFHGLVPGNQVLKELPAYDFLVLPTIAEGMPVTIIEAMKAGVLPVVNHLQGGIEELIGNNERGILIEQNKVENFAAALQQLQQQPQYIKTLATAASIYARKNFDANHCTAAIEKFIVKHACIKHNRQPKKVYGSRLDITYLPNRLVVFLRKYFLNIKY
ncbi:MAG: glycosyltransferase [Lacibacter sp.]